MPSPGELFAGRFRLHGLVGSGGMGEVWRATDEALGRIVAVKVLRPELLAEPGFADRFRIEARTLATIRHPGVVTVHDYQHGDAGAFLVMEYIDGESLAAVLRRVGRLDPAAAMMLVAQVAEALQAAHDRGVVHRDVKPANLLVGSDGAPVLTDFGIARAVDATALTVPGTVVGTPAYLAPEQVLGYPATPLSDIYSLGVVGYECLTGRRPFGGENSYDVARRRVHEPPPPLPDDIPRVVAAVIEGALAGEPGKRWRSAADLAARARDAATRVGADGQTTLLTYLPGRAALPAPPAPPAPPEPSAPASLPPTRVDSKVGVEAVQDEPGPVSPSPAPPVPQPQPVPQRRPVPQPQPVPEPQPAPPPRPIGRWEWVVPPRPATVTVAAVLFLATAVSMLGLAGVTLAVIEGAVAVLRDVAGQEWADAVGLGGTVGSLYVGLAGFGYLVVAANTVRGRRSVRGWATALAVPLLCCYLPLWCSLAGSDEQDGAQAVTDQLAAALPSWYVPLIGVWVVGGALCLLVALQLISLRSAKQYFGREPVWVYYYPYQPPG
jgi:serine/threonine protein kinase